MRVLLRRTATSDPTHGNICLAAEKLLCTAPNATSASDFGRAWTQSHRRNPPYLPKDTPNTPTPRMLVVQVYLVRVRESRIGWYLGRYVERAAPSEGLLYGWTRRSQDLRSSGSARTYGSDRRGVKRATWGVSGKSTRTQPAEWPLPGQRVMPEVVKIRF